eukprot:TRINITY_DN64647_c0_g1_i1.p1 TRINITY_DN64647_c0_g1~~TRINITY_DN64647_c0_g1_i1.p1  ORF type:complete len:107 (-),score=16.59 TRINITY_DN64647_c0_g1_i1:81-401(-)
MRIAEVWGGPDVDPQDNGIDLGSIGCPCELPDWLDGDTPLGHRQEEEKHRGTFLETSQTRAYRPSRAFCDARDDAGIVGSYKSLKELEALVNEEGQRIELIDKGLW